MAAIECDDQISYLAGELSGPEEDRFEKHLKKCPVCSLQLNELQETWFALSYDRNEAEPPTDLKSEVMDYVFADQRDEPKPKPLPYRSLKCIKKNFTPLTTVLVALLLIGFISVLWNNIHLRNTQIAFQKVTQDGPIQVQEAFTLHSKNPSESAGGVAYLIQQGRESRLVMLVNQMPDIKEGEVYQAWLLYDGSYYNCGTFRTDKNGSGVLTYSLPPNTHFDDIVVTLEPSDNDNQPQGKTLLGAL